jgi:hypothetical protein
MAIEWLNAFVHPFICCPALLGSAHGETWKSGLARTGTARCNLWGDAYIFALVVEVSLSFMCFLAVMPNWFSSFDRAGC